MGIKNVHQTIAAARARLFLGYATAFEEIRNRLATRLDVHSDEIRYLRLVEIGEPEPEASVDRLLGDGRFGVDVTLDTLEDDAEWGAPVVAPVVITLTMDMGSNGCILVGENKTPINVLPIRRQSGSEASVTMPDLAAATEVIAKALERSVQAAYRIG